MAFAYLVSVIKQGTSAGSGNSAAIDTTGANLIVISVGGVGGVVSDSNTNAWTALTVHGNNKLYYCYNPVVGAGHTFASNAASSFSCIAVAAFSGAASSPLDQQNGNTGGSGTTSLATQSVTPGDDNQLLVMGLGDFAPNGGSTAISVGTLLQSANINGGVSYGNAIAYEIQTTATTRNPSWSWLTGTGGSTAAAIGTFKAAAAGGATPSRHYYDHIIGMAA